MNLGASKLEFEAQFLRKLDELNNAVIYLAQQSGKRLTRTQLMERFEISRSIFSKLETDPKIHQGKVVHFRYLEMGKVKWNGVNLQRGVLMKAFSSDFGNILTPIDV
ncbi:hypothetical protein ICN10_00015 [Polynucleobacter sp. 86C-FISCH]|uniref:hypothetical protein n=1 Tax=Polynucleobacter sp. 86C-FISCH TaxID=2689101 RepID=UPI001C0DCCD5|nr:hypothetical protein [Polynucleobacter sp. 86C-FISCH]MBU3594783.1 hypothetical protein [Polynucleobacter sp. 86C-FISCH]